MSGHENNDLGLTGIEMDINTSNAMVLWAQNLIIGTDTIPQAPRKMEIVCYILLTEARKHSLGLDHLNSLKTNFYKTKTQTLAHRES